MTEFQYTDPPRSPIPSQYGVVPDPKLILLILIVLILVGMVVGALVTLGIGHFSWITINEALAELSPQSAPAIRNYVRSINLASHVFGFVLPVLGLAFWFYRRQMWRWLQLHRLPNWTLFIQGVLFVLVSLPLVQFLFYINKNIPLPDWMVLTETDTNDMIVGLLTMPSFMEFAFTLLVVAIVPALGEELVFRGVAQPALRRWTGSAHAAVWITAVIFSAIHFQFQGFLPRMFLGALLGYLLVWTQNLWVPILAHFFNNALQVALGYFSPDLIQVAASGTAAKAWSPAVGGFVAIMSLLFTVWIGQRIRRYNGRIAFHASAVVDDVKQQT